MRLKEIRIEKNLKQKEIAEKLSRTITCISDWERGRTEPSISDLTKLSQIFNCSVDYILGLEDDLGIKKTPAINYREEKLLRAFNKLEDNEKDKIIEDCEFFASLHKVKTK